MKYTSKSTGFWARTILLALFVPMASSSYATLLMTEDFSYPDTANIGLPGTGGWAQQSPGSGIYSVVSGKAVHIGNTGLDDLQVFTQKTFDIPAPTESVIYTAFTINMTETPAFTNGTYFAGLGVTGSASLRARLFAAKTATGVVGQNWRIAVGGSSGSSSGVTWVDDLMINQDYLIVTRYDQLTGDTNMWVDPTTEADPSTSVASAAGDRDVYSLVNNARTVSSNAYGTFTIDDLFIASTFKEAITGMEIPEPTSAMLFSSMILGMYVCSARSSRK